jgi:DNA uptake protein ComE-like DNA-binding protein
VLEPFAMQLTIQLRASRAPAELNVIESQRKQAVMKRTFYQPAGGAASSRDMKGNQSMLVRTIYVGVAVCGAIGAAAIAQITPSMTSPTQQASPKREVLRSAEKIDINTATAAELRRLPRLNARSATAIIEARSKSKFVDWNDFATRRVVPFFVREVIKDLVTF